MDPDARVSNFGPSPPMKTIAAQSQSNPSPGDRPPDGTPKLIEVAASSWIEYGVHQAQQLRKNLDDTVSSFIDVSGSRLSQIMSTSSAHLQQTIESLKDVKSEYDTYEDIAVGKIKEGILVAASNPLITGTCFGLGFLLLKRPRQFLYYSTMRLLVSEEAMVARADAKVKELRKSVDHLKAESEKLEKRALQAEEEMKRGRTKLRQAGNQIQGVIRSAYKVERQARGLKDMLGELPGREASRFRSQVSNLASEAKRERTALSKEIAKISNYGISV